MAAGEPNLDATFACLTAPPLSWLSSKLADLDLAEPEQQAVLAGAAECLTDAVRRKVSRLLLLELNAARVTGNLTGENSAARWAEFCERAGTLEFWTSLETHYPTLLPRLATVISGRTDAAVEFARRFAANRGRYGFLIEDAEPELAAVSFGAGDTHRGGRSVAVVTLATGDRLVYKPRPLRVDVALAEFLAWLYPDLAAAERIRVPDVLNCGTYGWSRFVVHQYCDTPAQLRTYYRRLGHWLAVARLFGTTDLHAENLIACGDMPVVVDCETLFTPHRVVRPSGAGDALDRAGELLRDTVLSSGLLPSRGVVLGWRGADISAGGGLPDQQPTMRAPTVVAAGTDHARLELADLPAPTAANLPAPQPDLQRYWPDVLAGFDELTGRLRDLDRHGSLESALAPFGDVDVRALLRGTEVYAELARMLWHPASLHDEPAAVERATMLLTQHGAANPPAPEDRPIIAAEIDNLLHGDIPYYQTTPASGWLRGPTERLGLGERHDVLADALHRWRTADLAVDREVIRASLVCAYINDGYQPSGERATVADPMPERLDERRQRLAAGVLQQLVRSAVRGDDGTVTWLAPVMNVTGWSVQQLSPDGYSGLAGVALLLAGYQRETDAGRALAVAGVPELARAAVATLRSIEDFRVANLREEYQSRPEPPGLYIGLGSQIWCWTALAELGAVSIEEGLRHAVIRGEQLPAALSAAEDIDLLRGLAGSAVGLVRLADRTGDGHWLDLAVSAGERLAEQARLVDGRACWPTEDWPGGLGGAAHGATGIGWALARLGSRAGRPDLIAVADAAFAFEQTLWEPIEGGWLDIRFQDETGVAAAWCHGSTGIGLLSADLLRRRVGRTDHADVVRRAAESSWRHGLGWNHTLCHGDLGVWEMVTTALGLGLGPAGLTRSAIDARIITGIEQEGPASGLARSAFVPGLMPGLGGVAYQLLRMHPDCSLPSVLVID